MKITAAVCVLLCALMCAVTMTDATYSVSSSRLLQKLKAAFLKPKGSSNSACKSVTGDVNGERHFVHICERDDGSGVCVTSKLTRCCPGDNIWNCSEPMSSAKLQVGRKYEEVAISLYPVMEGRSESICYLLDESHQLDLTSCGKDEDNGCKTKDRLVSRCTQNVAKDEPECSAETNLRGLKCVEGFKPPSCCSCDDGYVLMYGECIKFCPANCQERDGYPYGSGCRVCRSGYRTPDCCECADNYYRSADGGCKAICTDSALECTVDGCTKCSEGYKGQGCCELERAEVCKVNCIGERSDGTCTGCRNNALMPHCCHCAENYFKTETGECQPTPISRRVCGQNCDGRNLDFTCIKCKDSRFKEPYCCDCKSGYEKTDKGECHPRPRQGSKICLLNCQRKNRYDGTCDQCYHGFADPLCCTCEEGYEMNSIGDCEMRSAVMEDLVEAVEEVLRDMDIDSRQ